MQLSRFLIDGQHYIPTSLVAHTVVAEVTGAGVRISGAGLGLESSEDSRGLRVDVPAGKSRDKGYDEWRMVSYEN
jgi:hypothetical protein